MRLCQTRASPCSSILVLTLVVTPSYFSFSDFAAVGGPDPGQSPSLRGVPFADKAKAMLVALLGYPTTRTVQAILLLSWHEFSLNNDGKPPPMNSLFTSADGYGAGSFWAFAGMGLRMAQDLGLHLVSPRLLHVMLCGWR